MPEPTAEMDSGDCCTEDVPEPEPLVTNNTPTDENQTVPPSPEETDLETRKLTQFTGDESPSKATEGWDSPLKCSPGIDTLESRLAATTINDDDEPASEAAAAESLDEVLNTEAHSAALNFAMEHRILLRAVLDLLAERDQHAPVVGMMDPVIVKSGPLKKASHLVRGTWKVKYVEIRRGMFSYYENVVSKDATGEAELLRKDIPLEAHSCTCRAVKLHQKALKLAPGGAMFELTVKGSKRLWMAKSREERQAWIQAVNNAMAGASVTRGDSFTDHRGLVRGVSPRSPFKSDLRQYLKTQGILRSATCQSEYALGLKELLTHSLKIPVKWIAKQGELATESTELAFQEANVSSSIEQLWKDLLRDSVCIDNEIFRGDSDHGPDKIISALMRRLLGFGRDGDSPRGRHDLSETQALIYARDILLSGNRTRSGGDSYFVVNALCKHPELVVVVPNAMVAEPVIINVTEDNSESSFLPGKGGKSGWIRTRNTLQRTWKKLFFVLSEGTLSYYESALPRPHRLRGQLVLTDAAIITTSREREMDGKAYTEYVMQIATKEGMVERQLLFQSADRLMDWTYALESASKKREHHRLNSAPIEETPKKANRRRSSTGDDEAFKKGHRRRSSANGADILTSPMEGVNFAVEATKVHAASLGLDPDTIESRLSMYARKKTSALVVSVEAATEYKICTTDPQGDESEDTWALLRTQFIQKFRLTGGQHGRIMRGEELVNVSVVKCTGIAMLGEVTEEGLAEPVSPRRSGRNRRIFRSFNNSDDDLGGTSD